MPAVGTASGASRGLVALPSPKQVRAEFQRMVDFGPRLTGSKAHDRYVQWLQREFVAAGAELLPCDDYAYERWSVGQFGLDLLDGSSAGEVKVATYYTRSQETPANGVNGPLVYGGIMPIPSINGTDLRTLNAAIARYPEELASWVSAIPSTLGGSAEGSILVVDLPLPAPLTAAAFLPIATYLHWPGHSAADWAQIDYKRTWILPGLGLPLTPFAELGAAGVVFIVDRSYQALKGNYLPFDHGYEPVPALYVDRDTGRALRTQAEKRPTARLTLTATRTEVTCSSVTAVLPGQSDETVILNTHTDGQGFVEENGGVAFVQLARHFGSLPAAQRLKRTLVFAAWPGHMSGGMPELEGWMGAHPDLVERAAAAMTIEHLGCSEWLDTVDKGYHPTGENEVFGVWTTQGKLFELTRDALISADLARTALLRPPVQFGVGGAFQSAGVPQIGAIAGPEYLLTVGPNGDMDKLDERLAAKQIAWLAEITKRLDGVSAAELRAGDPTLGSTAPEDDISTPSDCEPSQSGFVVDAGHGRGLAVRFYGRRRKHGGVLVTVVATGAAVAAVTVELRRGAKLVARSESVRVGTSMRSLVLRRSDQLVLRAGTYTLVVRQNDRVLARRSVRIGRLRPAR